MQHNFFKIFTLVCVVLSVLFQVFLFTPTSTRASVGSKTPPKPHHAAARFVFSQDGNTLASLEDGRITVLDLGSRQERAMFAGSASGAVTGLALSPDSQILASVAEDTITLWEVASGQERAALVSPANGVISSLTFSPDGQTLAGVADSAQIWVWDVGSSAQRWVLSSSDDAVSKIAFSPDGTILASRGENERIKLWDMATGQERLTLANPTGVAVIALGFSPDGLTLASVDVDANITLWDPGSGYAKQLLAGHQDLTKVFAFSPDGSRLASRGRDTQIKLWDVVSGREQGSLADPLGTPVTALVFSPDGNTLASVGKDTRIALWDVATGTLRQVLVGHNDFVAEVAFSSNKQTLTSVGKDGQVIVWDLATASDNTNSNTSSHSNLGASITSSYNLGASTALEPVTTMPAAMATRVMVVGDSISQGSSGDFTWRYWLWKHLEATVPGSVNLVGDRTTLYDNITETQGSTAYLDGDFDRDHHALWGQLVGYEKDTIAAAVRAAGPDVLLVLLGTNDIAWGGTPKATLADMRTFIAAAREARPGLDIILGHVPGRYDFFTHKQLNVGAFAAYNRRLDALAAALDTRDERVLTAPVESGFDAARHTYDGTHPNPTGEAEIAQAFADRLASLGIGKEYGPVPQAISWPVAGPVPQVTTKDKGATLSWANRPGSNAVLVEVRNATLGTGWDRLPFAVEGPTWTAGLLVPGHRYRFRLVPVKYVLAGQPGAASPSVTVLGKIPSQPGFLRVSEVVPHSVRLTWGASTNASGYFIEQTDLGSGEVQRLPYPISATTFVAGLLEDDRNYRWRVIPVNGAIEGPASAPVLRVSDALRVMTWNMKAEDGQFDGWVQTIGNLKPQILGLQEACVSDVQGVVKKLKELYNLDYYVMFGPVGGRPFCGIVNPRRGQAILSLSPMSSRANVIYKEYDDPLQKRGYMAVTVTVGPVEIRVFNTHISTHDDIQEPEITQLYEAQSRSGTAILLGDFNVTPENPALNPIWNAGFKDADKNCYKHALPQCKQTQGSRKIDYIFLRSGLKADEVEVYDTEFSDHRPLIARIHW